MIGNDTIELASIHASLAQQEKDIGMHLGRWVVRIVALDAVILLSGCQSMPAYDEIGYASPRYHYEAPYYGGYNYGHDRPYYRRFGYRDYLENQKESLREQRRYRKEAYKEQIRYWNRTHGL